MAVVLCLRQCRSLFEPGRLQIFEQTLAASFAPKPAFTISPESAGSVEHVRAIDPDNSRLDLCRNLQRDINAFAPNRRGQSVDRIVRQFNRFGRGAECHGGEHRSENISLSDRRSRMNIAQQGWRKVESTRRHGSLRLPAGRSLGYSLIHEPADALQLHWGNDCSNIDALIQRQADAQLAHALANFTG